MAKRLLIKGSQVGGETFVHRDGKWIEFRTSNIRRYTVFLRTRFKKILLIQFINLIFVLKIYDFHLFLEKFSVNHVKNYI
jgi:hypothetical protein